MDINVIIKAVIAVLPLRIRFVSWDDTVLTLSGSDWSLSSLSAWRLSDNAGVCYGCDDREVSLKINGLKKLKIVGIKNQSRVLSVDPAFVLSDDSILEIFSTDTYEPWVLKLPTGDIFTGLTNQ